MRKPYLGMFLILIFLPGCSSQGTYKGYVPVTQMEAETYAKQFVEKYNKGDKSEFMEFTADVDATVAADKFTGQDSPAAYRNPTPEGYAVQASWARSSNAMLAEYIRSFDFIEIIPSGKTFCMTLEKNVTFEGKSSTGKCTYTLVKNKDGKIVAGGVKMD